MKRILFFMISLSLLSVARGESLMEQMSKAGLVDILSVDPTVAVRLMYARDDNFTGKILYKDLDRAMLCPQAAKAVARAQKDLTALRPGYRLLVKDAARPMSVQRSMFDAVKGTPKAGYVANPSKGGGLHNYGMAVDITIIDPDGNEIDMGTPVDHLGVEANIDREEQLVSSGFMSPEALVNRRLLRRVMTSAGFRTIRTEWWHFNFVTLAHARANCRRLDF